MYTDSDSYLKSMALQLSISCIDNTVVDTISIRRLDYNLALNRYADEEDASKEEKWNNFLTLNRAL